MSGEAAHRYRLYFALWPDAAVRDALADYAAAWSRQSSGRLKALPAARLHMTLAFIGEIEGEAVRQRCQDVASLVSGSAFRLRLDSPGAFGRERRRHIWLGPGRPPAALQELQAQLRSVLAGAQLPVDTKPFVPHVTLLRGERPGAAPDGAIDWPVRDFVLVDSRREGGGVRYEVLRRYELAEGGT